MNDIIIVIVINIISDFYWRFLWTPRALSGLSIVAASGISLSGDTGIASWPVFTFAVILDHSTRFFFCSPPRFFVRTVQLAVCVTAAMHKWGQGSWQLFNSLEKTRSTGTLVVDNKKTYQSLANTCDEEARKPLIISELGCATHVTHSAPNCS